MKKRLFFATILALAFTMTSCLRDDDWEMLKHPLNITGEMHPTFGIPIGSGQMNMNDLLTSMSAIYEGIIDESSNTITVQYNVNVSDTIYALNYIPTSKRKGAAKTDFYTKDTIVETAIDIDFFNNVIELQNLSIAHVYVVLSVGVEGNAPDFVVNHVHAVFDSMELWYDDYNGVHKQFIPTDVDLSTFSVQIDNIQDGIHQTFDTMDMAQMINERPSKLYAKYHMKFNVDSEIISENIANMTIPQILAGLNMTHIIYSADMNVEMPLSVSINDMAYSFYLDLGKGLSGVNLDSILNSINEGLSAEITMSEFTLATENGIPLNLTLSAYGCAADSVTRLCTLFTDKKVHSAPRRQVDPIVYEADRSQPPSKDTIVAQLNRTVLDQLNSSKYLRVDITVDSRDPNNNLQHVAVKRDDFLQLKAYLKVHPDINVNIELK